MEQRTYVLYGPVMIDTIATVHHGVTTSGGTMIMLQPMGAARQRVETFLNGGTR